MVELKKFDFLSDQHMQNEIDNIVEDVNENNWLLATQILNYTVFVYVIIVFIFTLKHTMCCYFGHSFPKSRLSILIYCTIFGYILLIPLSICSYCITYGEKYEINDRNQ